MSDLPVYMIANIVPNDDATEYKVYEKFTEHHAGT